jgi:hypothetical protein
MIEILCTTTTRHLRVDMSGEAVVFNYLADRFDEIGHFTCLCQSRCRKEATQIKPSWRFREYSEGRVRQDKQNRAQLLTPTFVRRPPAAVTKRPRPYFLALVRPAGCRCGSESARPPHDPTVCRRLQRDDPQQRLGALPERTGGSVHLETPTTVSLRGRRRIRWRRRGGG